jgi:hypothetical protein
LYTAFAVTFLFVLPLNIFGVLYFIPLLIPAMVFGFVRAIWFCAENGSFGSDADLRKFNLISGAVFGLLCYPVFDALRNGQPHYYWSFWNVVEIYFLLAGGTFAAERNFKRLLPLVNNKEKTAWKSIVVRYVVLVVCLGLLDGVMVREILLKIIPYSIKQLLLLP